MANPLNSQVVHATEVINDSVTDWDVAQQQAVGMAFQVVAQASAAAVMDATDYLRSINAVNVAAISTMTARMVEDRNPGEWKDAIQQANENSAKAAELFETVGRSSAHILNHFKVG